MHEWESSSKEKIRGFMQRLLIFHEMRDMMILLK